MRNELVDRSDPETKHLLAVVQSRSEQTCLKQYVKEIYDAEQGEGVSLIVISFY
jgi:hypothetical protein